MIKINLENWFSIFFPNSYVCSFGESGFLTGDHVTETLPFDGVVKAKYRKINDNGAGVFFTPNGVQNKAGKHSLSNFQQINSWYIDLDIPESKGAKTADELRVREERKADIRGRILFAPLPPTFTVESRNGFHLYWLSSSATTENFKPIELGIYDYFVKDGADLASTKIVTLLRVPGFYNWKNGEQFRVKIIPMLCAFYPDLSPRAYSEEDMLIAYPAKITTSTTEQPPTERIFRTARSYKSNFDLDNVFARVHEMPIEQVVQRLSGTYMVGGEQFELKRGGGTHRRLNLWINGHSTANFIDLEKNMIFGAKESGYNGPTITQWLRYYGLTYKEIAEGYQKIFNF